MIKVGEVVICLSISSMSEDNYGGVELEYKAETGDIANIFDDEPEQQLLNEDFDNDIDPFLEQQQQEQIERNEFDFDANHETESSLQLNQDFMEKDDDKQDKMVYDEPEAGDDNKPDKIDQNEDEVRDVDEDEDEDENIYSIKAHKLSSNKETTQKKKVRKANKFDDKSEQHQQSGFTNYDKFAEDDYSSQSMYDNEDPSQRKRRLLEEKMDMAVKSKGVKRRKADEDDLERMQDDRIDFLKDQMIKAANLDVEKNSQGLIATEKLKLLSTVNDIISRADLAISILDNNLLEAVRLWLEPLPDASMPAYQIQKDLINALESLPIKTDHLVASGIGKVLVFYQRSKRTEPVLKKVVDRLIGDWTRPILNKSDSYKDRTIKFHDYNKHKFANKLASSRKKVNESKSLYEQNAERKKRAAIPSARTTAYKVAPRVDASLLKRNYGRPQDDERFKRINSRISTMSQKKKTVKKSGPSIEGRNLTM